MGRNLKAHHSFLGWWAVFLEFFQKRLLTNAQNDVYLYVYRNIGDSIVMATVISFVFIFYVLICLIYGYNNPSKCKPLSDNYQIGYISSNQKTNNDITYLQSEIRELNNEIKNLKRKKKKKKFNHPMLQDCIDALIALGSNKADAKNQVEQFLKNNNVDSIEEFIVKFFKKKG